MMHFIHFYMNLNRNSDKCKIQNDNEMRYAMYENKKITKIVDETMTYFLNRNARDVSTTIKKMNDFTSISVEAKGVDVSHIEMEELVSTLNSKHRQAEMEEYYWMLTGEGQASDELMLVAVMVDSAKLDMHDDTVKIELIRENN